MPQVNVQTSKRKRHPVVVVNSRGNTRSGIPVAAGSSSGVKVQVHGEKTASSPAAVRDNTGPVTSLHGQTGQYRNRVQ